MKKRFSDADIVRFLYEEMQPAERERFVEALCSDEALWERYERLQAGASLAGQARIEPSEAACERVLERLRDTEGEDLPAYGEFSLLDRKKLTLSLRFPLRVRFHLNTVLLTGALLLLALPLFRTRSFAPDNAASAALPQAQPVPAPPAEQMLGWEDGFITERIDKIGLDISRLEANM